MTFTKITDHAEAMRLLTTGRWWDKARMQALVKILGDQVQLLDDVIWDVSVNSLLANAEGQILDEYGDIFDELRGSLGDDDYRRVLGAVMAAHQADGTAVEVIYLSSLMLDESVRYSQYNPAHYRLEYSTAGPISGDWEKRVLRILEILRPVGVSFALVEGSSTGAGTFRFDSGPGFDGGKLARRVI